MMKSSAFSEPTLVLNRNWMPIQVCSARRAILLMYKDLARVMGEGYVLHDFTSWIQREPRVGQLYIQGVSFRMGIPEVIVLRSCDRFMRPRVAFSRRNLFRRDQHTCQYCGKRGSSAELSVDHVVPRSLGGGGSWTNCVVACRRCNERKANQPMHRVGMKLMRPPREPPSHLAFTTYIGRQKDSWKQFMKGLY